MKIIEQYHQIITPSTTDDWLREAQYIELAARTCYKSEDKIDARSYSKMIKMLVDRDHTAMVEFGRIIVKFVTDRGVTHELVRHRIASYAQESTRYCNYSHDKFNKEITVIKPYKFFNTYDESVIPVWEGLMKTSEEAYFNLLDDGFSPQVARSVLPNSLKTEIVMSMNFREARTIFKLRCSAAAHPQMSSLMAPFYLQCRNMLPEVFLIPEVDEFLKSKGAAIL